MAWIASPPISWGGDPPQSQTELFGRYSIDVKSHVVMPNIVAAVPTTALIQPEDTVAYAMGG